MTVQGILPYYYNRISTSQPDNPQRNDSRREIIDRCLYNTMADTPECLERKLSEIKSAHFTICQKPWTCTKWGARSPTCEMPRCNPLCKQLHEEWFRLRHETELFYGVQVVNDPCSGSHGYIPMDLNAANIKKSKNIFSVMPIPDTSPDLIKPPKPESRYRIDSEDWDNFVGGHKPGGNKKDNKGKK